MLTHHRLQPAPPAASPSSTHDNSNKTKGPGTSKRAEFDMISTHTMGPTEPDLVLTHTERAFLAYHINYARDHFEMLQ